MDNQALPPGGGRRDFLRGSAAAMAVASAYGMTPSRGLAQGVPNQYDGSRFQLKAAEPNPRKGGVLKMAIFSRQPHFDIHQSGTFANVGTQGCMFDNLIRRDPRDGGKTIIPDLAHSWDISKDGTSYTFMLRKDVQFHDGAELTSADVKATFDRIVKPPTGISFPRSSLFTAVSEIKAHDKHGGIQAGRTAAGELYHVLDRQWLERDPAPEDAGGERLQPASRGHLPGHRSLQVAPPGRERALGVREEQILLEPEVPYLNGLEIYHALPFSPEMASALLSNPVDSVRVTDPAKRLALIRQAEMLMEEDPPLWPFSWEKINDAWYTYVKGLYPYDYFGQYDVDRYDTVWLDK